MRKKILVIEDEKNIVDILVFNLARARLSYRAALWADPADSMPRARLSLLVSRLTSMPMPPIRSAPW